MTIKGPDAHNYGRGLNDLLGWKSERNHNYVEKHRSIQQQQEQEPAGGFADALQKPTPPPPRVSFMAPTVPVELEGTGQVESYVNERIGNPFFIALRESWQQETNKIGKTIFCLILFLLCAAGLWQSLRPFCIIKGKRNYNC